MPYRVANTGDQRFSRVALSAAPIRIASGLRTLHRFARARPSMELASCTTRTAQAARLPVDVDSGSRVELVSPPDCGRGLLFPDGS